MVAYTPDGEPVSTETLEDVVHELLQYQAAQFDNICEHCGGEGCDECEGSGEAGDLEVSGADLVDVFSAIRPRLRAALVVAASVTQHYEIGMAGDDGRTVAIFKLTGGALALEPTNPIAVMAPNPYAPGTQDAAAHEAKMIALATTIARGLARAGDPGEGA